MQIQLINLARSKNRLDRFYDENFHIRDCVSRFEAIDGFAFETNELVPKGLIEPGLAYKPGAIGCALSHRLLWLKCVSENTAFTIAEDDAVFSYRFEETSAQILKTVGADWDLIFWGWPLQCFLWVSICGDASLAEIRANPALLKLHLSEFKQHKEQSVALRLRHIFGTVCYSISPSGAQRLLSECFPLSPDLIKFSGFPIVIENQGIDGAMNRVYPQIAAYVSFPPLVAVDARLESTIGIR